MKWLSFLILFSANLNAEQDKYTYVDFFGGLDNFHESSKIDLHDGQYLQNVLTDSGYLEKRTGNVRWAQLLSGYAVRYLQEFNVNSNRYLITHSSASVYQMLNGVATRLNLVTTANEIDCAAGFARTFCVNRNDASWYWDGTSTAPVANMPVCQFVEFADYRLYCANTASSSSEIRISSYGGSADWTIPVITPLPDQAPGQFYIQKDDGEAITCFKNTPWGKFIGKRHSTHLLKGYGHLTWYIRPLDPTIGCVDDRSVQMVDGVLVWLSLEGIWAWDGSGPPVLISKEIDPLVLSIRQLQSNVNSWLYSSQADWQSGTQDTNGAFSPWDFTSPAGSAVNKTSGPFTDTATSDFASGTLDQVSTAAALYPSGSIGIAISSFGFPNSGFEDGGLTNWKTNGVDTAFRVISTNTMFGTYAMDNSDASAFNGSTVSVALFGGDGCNLIYGRSFSQSGTIGAVATTENIIITTQNYNSYRRAVLVNSSSLINSCADGHRMNYATVSIHGAGIFAYKMIVHELTPTTIRFMVDFPEGDQYYSSGTFTSRAFNTGISTPIWGGFNYTTSYATSGAVGFRTQTGSNGSLWGTASTVAFNGAKIQSEQLQYVRYVATFTATYSTASPTLDSTFFSATSTGVYRSAVKQIGDLITAWKTINCTDESTLSGAVSFSMRSATFAFSADATVPSFTAQTNNQQVAVSVSSYTQFRLISSVFSPTDTAKIDQCLTSWQEGTERPVASGVKDRRYFLAVTTSPLSGNNDVTLVWQKNKKWTMFNGPSYYSIGNYDNDLYAGDSSTNSYIWKTLQKDVFNDDGDAIKSLWISKDFAGDAPHNNKVLQDFWVEAAYQSASSVTVSVAANKSGTFVNKNLNLDVTANFVNRRVPLSSGTLLGKYHRIKLENLNKDQYFRVNGLSFTYSIQPLRADE